MLRYLKLTKFYMNGRNRQCAVEPPEAKAGLRAYAAGNCAGIKGILR